MAMIITYYCYLSKNYWT